MKKVGISLSGGGVKALIYAGVLQALEDNGIEVDVVGGLSGGAIVGALYASGYSGKQILEIAMNTNFFTLIRPTSVIAGEIINHDLLEHALKQYIKATTFDSLNKRMVIFCSDIESKEQVVIKSGDLISAIIGSCAVPPVIKPIYREGHKLVDGGFSTAYGGNHIRKAGAKYVIGISVEKWIDVSAMPGIMKDFVDALGVAWQTVSVNEQKMNPVDFKIVGFGDNTNMLDFNADKEGLYKKGYEKTIEFIDIIKAGVNKRNSILDFIFQ